MAISFNGTTKVISLSQGTTSLSVKNLWTEWVNWLLASDNSKYAIALEQVGGNDIDQTAGTKIPIYIYIRNDWKIKPQEANHTLTISDGILLVNGGGDPFNNTAGAYTVRINYQQPVQAITISTGETVAPSASEIRSAIGLAAADLDDQFDAIPSTADINAEVDTALADYDPPTRAELTADKDEIIGEIPTVSGITNDIDANSTELADIKKKANMIPGLY